MLLGEGLHGSLPRELDAAGTRFHQWQEIQAKRTSREQRLRVIESH